MWECLLLNLIDNKIKNKKRTKTTMYNQHFYKNIGKLMYAIVKYDGRVSREEIDSVKKIVRQQLVPLDEGVDAFGTDNAFITEFEFETLLEKNKDASKTLDEFFDFFKEHHFKDPNEWKSLCLKITDAIAKDTQHTNKRKKEIIELINVKINNL